MLNVFSDFCQIFPSLSPSPFLCNLWLTFPMLRARVGGSSRTGGKGAEQWWVDRLITNVICNLLSGWWLKEVQRYSAEGEERRKEAAWGRNRAGARQASTESTLSKYLVTLSPQWVKYFNSVGCSVFSTRTTRNVINKKNKIFTFWFCASYESLPLVIQCYNIIALNTTRDREGIPLFGP